MDGPDGLQSLVIDKASPSDAGMYSVTVNNPQGEATSQAPLSVSGESAFVQGDQEIKVCPVKFK